ncbi:MAG: hypothetical protein ONB46_18710 [candidate division KSB1 bacterium]|nr:hypothetical protein [candidate division KSB1 bacterium]MDZ7367913.1 hypothetical protein [candidate division KSB1 bacterium]MDZ7406520.1 hypothetical protein [candidate division KSB1 bacterium]
MAKKDSSFQAKVAKTAAGADAFAVKCPKCGEPIHTVQLVVSERTPKGSYKYNERYVGSCKCTSKEIYG